MDEKQLTELFRKLGADDPEGWAHSQMAEGIPQLARYLFLRQAWREVIPEGDESWIDQQLNVRPSGPGGAIAPALQRMLDAGVAKSDLTDVARIMQWQLLFRLCYLMGDPGDIETEVGDISWGLFQCDAEGRPLQPLAGLHEDVLGMDPTGREMKPR